MWIMLLSYNNNIIQWTVPTVVRFVKYPFLGLIDQSHFEKNKMKGHNGIYSDTFLK